MKNNGIKTLLKLIKDYPDLPIYFYSGLTNVGEQFVGEFKLAQISEFVYVNLHGKNEMIPKSDSNMIYDYLVNMDERYDIPPRELDEIRKRVENLNWRKAIFVYLDIPGNMAIDKIKNEVNDNE